MNNNSNKKRNIILILISIIVGILGGLGFYNINKDNSTEEIINNAVDEIKDYITTYNMTQEEIIDILIKRLPKYLNASP